MSKKVSHESNAKVVTYLKQITWSKGKENKKHRTSPGIQSNELNEKFRTPVQSSNACQKDKQPQKFRENNQT